MIEINGVILLTQTLTFLIAMAVLWKIAWKPLCAMLSRREETIRKELELIEQNKQAFKRMEDEYNRKLAQVEADSEKILRDSVEEANRRKLEILAAARQEAELLRKRGLALLKAEESKQLQDAMADIFSLSLQISEKLLKKNLDRSVHEQMFQETLRDLEELKVRV